MNDFVKLQKEPPPGVYAVPTEDNIMLWQGVILGPYGTPFEDGVFKLSMEFKEDYPHKPPSVKFVSRMFHPNIYTDGNICLDILQNMWSPSFDICAVLTSLQSLLGDPNPNSPANANAAQLYEQRNVEYRKRVREIVEESWIYR